ncbi:unnamed protein product [Symbiodinium sp. CCMP2592]|nr:unnamed protein product [Symbiodinium sp. CCMP2592]
MRVKDTDPDLVKSCFMVQSFNEMAWLNHMDLNSVRDYKKAIESSRGVANQVQFTVDKIQEIRALKENLKVLENRGNAAEQYIYDLVLEKLSSWGKGEWLGAVRSRFKALGGTEDADD